MNINLIPLYRFWIQIIAIVVILTGSGIGIISGEKRNATLYSNLIYLMLGYLFPSPGSGSKKDGQLVEHSDNTNIYPPEGSK